MSISRRDAVSRLAALTAALPLASRLPALTAANPLDGTIADYQAGRRRGEWTAVEVTTHALERCRDAGARFRAIDVLDGDVALRAARGSDDRLRVGKTLGPLDGVPVFAKAIYDMNGLPTTGSSAE